MNERRSLFPSDLDPATLDAGWRAIGAKRRAARIRKRLALAAPVLALSVVLLFALGRKTPGPHPLALTAGGALPPQWTPTSAEVVALDDGSRLELAPGAVLRTLGGSDPGKVELGLEKGSTTFDIRPGGPRVWMIAAGATRVRVLGTRFTVTRDALHTRVSVERGKVRVDDTHLAGGMRELVAGDDVDIDEGAPVSTLPSPPSPPGPPAPTLEGPVESTDAPRAIAVSDLPTEPVPSKKLPPARPTPSAHADDAADPMERADAARRAGEPREALAILATVVASGGPNAALAAFTTGKIHSETLGDLAAGATWFERSIHLGLPASLDDDAHARVVECYGRAGRTADATVAAARYEEKYPGGRNLARVKRWAK